MIRLDTRRKEQPIPIRWGDLPHRRLLTEIAQSIAYRSPHEAHYEGHLQELSAKLSNLCQSDHVEYARLISAEMKRALRICRDIYRGYLAMLNNASRTAKWEVALNFAIAPLACQILRREITSYLSKTKVEPWIAEIFLSHNVGLFIPLNVDIQNPAVENPRPDPSIEDLVSSCIPDSAFQDLKKRFKRESFIVGGRFSKSHVLRCAMSHGAKIDDLLGLYDDNEIWVSQAGSMWDDILHEIIAQQVQINLEERSDAMAALETLSLFDRCAGPLYAEASERYPTFRMESGRTWEQKSIAQECRWRELWSLREKRFFGIWRRIKYA
jgi:hypothetical protein